MDKVQRLSREGVQVIEEKSNLEKVATYFYILKDPRNGAIKYVGRSVNLKNRYRHHLWESKKRNRTKKERWVVSLLRRNLKPIMQCIYTEVCTVSDAISIEKMLFKKLNKRYDLKNEPDAFLGNALVMSPVYQFDLEGNLINKFHNAHQAELATGVKDCNISLCCKRVRKSAGGYLWSFKDSSDPKSPNKTATKPVKCLNTGEIYSSARNAYRATGISWKAISATCIGRQKSAGKLKWEFVC